MKRPRSKQRVESICKFYAADNRWVLFQRLRIVFSSKVTNRWIVAENHFSQTIKIYNRGPENHQKNPLAAIIEKRRKENKTAKKSIIWRTKRDDIQTKKVIAWKNEKTRIKRIKSYVKQILVEMMWVGVGFGNKNPTHEWCGLVWYELNLMWIDVDYFVNYRKLIALN